MQLLRKQVSMNTLYQKEEEVNKEVNDEYK